MTGSTLLLWTESSQKPLLKTFFYNNNGTREVKIFQTLLKKDILQTNFSNLYFMAKLNGWEENLWYWEENFSLIGLSNAILLWLYFFYLV